MKFLQDHGIVPAPSHFVQTPASNALISVPFRIGIRRPSPPPKTSTSLSQTRPKKCLARKAPNSFFDFLVIQASSLKTPSSFHQKTLIPLMAAVSSPLPCFAAGTEQLSSKINVESALVSVDDFFNRYPYFVASLAFIWLVVAPLTQEYLNKFKFVSCIEAFRKLRDDPRTQLLDIRNKQSVASLKTPNLKILNKGAVNLDFVEGCEEEFVKEVLKSFQDPGSTIICVLDNFDGNSLKVAKLLFQNGFKEAYAIKGGLLGKDGWQAIQETLLPPSLHVYPTKNSRQSPDQADESHKENAELLTSFSKDQEVIKKDGYMESMGSSSTAQILQGRPQSPYTSYEDLKPPTSPTPSCSLSRTAT